jgi:hypothetical protein
VGFGVAPKQSFSTVTIIQLARGTGKVRDREDAIASTRDARATPHLRPAALGGFCQILSQILRPKNDERLAIRAEPRIFDRRNVVA